MNQEIVALVEHARSDDLPLSQQHAAFAELVHRFEESALGWSLERLDDPEEAKDATQDAFIAAWLKLRQLREPAAFGVWLKRLIATQCGRRRRKSARREGLPKTGHPEAGQCYFERRELERSLVSAMSTLSESEYRVVVLFSWSCFTFSAGKSTRSPEFSECHVALSGSVSTRRA
jgi:DNA-directed RNA polymerase specialized sigma24 family protein